jgi:MoaA/NifB/PqqE/SkfB family radical SAM enzyme
MNINAWLNTLGTRCRTLPVVILYVTEGCNLRCLTCSYRHARPDELSLQDIIELSLRLKAFGLRHIVYSGGEPLLRKDFPAICAQFSSLGVRQTLLTNGVLLQARAPEVVPHLAEIIVSLDGPDSETHDGIRGGAAFDRILTGLREVRALRDRPVLSVRTVVQKRNFRSLPAIVRLARNLHVERISFLAADLLSDGFGRNGHAVHPSREAVLLDAGEVEELSHLITRMAGEYREEFSQGFIAETPAKLRNIALYYGALLGLNPFPSSACNAPQVSAVISSSGALLPCFFLPSFADLRQGDLARVLNLENIRATREAVRERSPDRCRTCVCTLHVSPAAALADRF